MINYKGLVLQRLKFLGQFFRETTEVLAQRRRIGSITRCVVWISFDNCAAMAATINCAFAGSSHTWIKGRCAMPMLIMPVFRLPRSIVVMVLVACILLTRFVIVMVLIFVVDMFFKGTALPDWQLAQAIHIRSSKNVRPFTVCCRSTHPVSVPIRDQ